MTEKVAGITQETKPQPKGELRRLLYVFLRFEKLLLPHWPRLALLIVLGTCWTVCTLYAANAGGRSFDALMAFDWPVFRRWWFINMLGTLGFVVCHLFRRLNEVYLVQRVLLTMQQKLFSHISRQSVAFHESRPVGEHMYRVTQDPYSAAAIICSAIPMVLDLGVRAFLIVLSASVINPYVSLGLLMYFVSFVLWAHFLAGVVRRFLRRQRASAQENTAALQESLSGFRAVLAYGREGFERLRFFSSLKRLYRRNMSYKVMSAFFGASSKFVERVFATIVSWLMTGYFVVIGEMSPGEWFAFNLLLGQVMLALESIVLALQTIRVQLVMAERMVETLDVESVLHDKKGAKRLPPVRGHIEFDNVRFSYVPGEEVLKGISFTVEPGQCVALAGASGSGKSTTVGLIERFYDVGSGSVKIDGHDVREVTQRSLRSKMSLAFQEPMLCSGTILDNFRYAAPEASFADVREVAHVVDLDDFIQTLEKGYDTELTESIGLSGGQKQRLALGRALLVDAPLLLLDEPTSALDPGTEETVVKRLRAYAAGKTIVMVTHSLRNVYDADKILLFESGAIVAEGTHDELMGQSEMYARMWEVDQTKREHLD